MEISSIISEIEKKLSSGGNARIEDVVWETIAGNYSPDWVSARTELHFAENALFTLNKPENRPLGLIGCALAADEINLTLDLHVQALTNFTIIDESLRQKEVMQQMLKTLTDKMRTANESLHVSQEVDALTQKFSLHAPVTPEAPRNSLIEKFMSFAKRLKKQTPAISQPLCTRRP